MMGEAFRNALSLLCLVCLLLQPARSKEDDEMIEYQNEIACDLDVTCPKGYGMNAVYGKAGFLTDPTSTPIPSTDDHQWFWNCEKIGYWKVEEEYCYTYSTNTYEGDLVAFRCPKDFYIAGLSTTATSNPVDHLWSVRCCRQPGLCISDCCLSDYLNDFGGDIEHKVRKGNFFVGIFSHIDFPWPPNNKRRWKVGSCRIERCDLKHYLKKYLYYKK